LNVATSDAGSLLDTLGEGSKNDRLHAIVERRPVRERFSFVFSPTLYRTVNLSAAASSIDDDDAMYATAKRSHL